MASTEKSVVSKQTSVFTKVLQNRKYRKKFIRTLCVLLAYTTLGFFYGNLGPALPDIQLLTGESLDVMSWLFTATYAGSLIGALICGPICDRVGPQFVLFVSVFMASCLTGVFIYTSSFTAMLVVRVVTGIFIGGVDLGGIASISALWKAEARPYMHALQCMISIGGIIAPFIIQPFLAQSTQLVKYSTNHSTILRNNVSECFSNYTSPSTYNTSVSKNENLKLVLTANNNSGVCLDCNNITVGDCEHAWASERVLGETKIQYAFIIFAVIGVVASVSVFVFVVFDCRRKQNISKRSTAKAHHIEDRTSYEFSYNLKLTLLGITAIQSYLSAALGLKVYALLPSFFVIQFGWSTSKASVATSGFWIGKAVSRFAGIFLSTVMKQSQMIPLFSLIYIISSVCLTVAAIHKINALAWVVTVTMGIGLSLLRSCIFTMTEEKITHVSGKVASLYLVFFVLGGMVDPLYTGYLMDGVSSMWFTYLLVVESTLFLILFALVKVLLKFGMKREIAIEIEIDPINSG